MLDLLMVPMELQTSNNLNVLSVLILATITVIAAFVLDLGLVAAVGGGTLATAVVFIFPALMFRSAVQEEEGEAKEEVSIEQKREVIFCLALMFLGILMGAIGVWLALASV